MVGYELIIPLNLHNNSNSIIIDLAICNNLGLVPYNTQIQYFQQIAMSMSVHSFLFLCYSMSVHSASSLMDAK